MKSDLYADEYAALGAQKLQADIAAEFATIEKFVEEHGCFAEMVRIHNGDSDGPV